MKRLCKKVSFAVVTLIVFATLSYAQSKISAGTILEGFVLDSKETNFPMEVKIVSIDKTGNFKGEVTWSSLESVHKLEGKLSGNTITFKEVSAIKKGSAHLNCEYALVIDGDSLDGRWVEPGFDSGVIKLKIK